MANSLKQVYKRLLKVYGPQSWWPAEHPFEVMVGAVLTQNTSWKNVEKAIERLREADALDLMVMHQMPYEELAELIRPAGYYRLKARRLKNLVQLAAVEFEGDLQRLFALGRDALRERLLQVNGIGPETADSIVLYAAELPIFVVDNYTARLTKRHGWIEPAADYHEIQDEFHSALPADTQLFNEFHALIVRIGHEFCGRRPRCESCPLVDLLPPSGPLDFER